MSYEVATATSSLDAAGMLALTLSLTLYSSVAMTALHKKKKELVIILKNNKSGKKKKKILSHKFPDLGANKTMAFSGAALAVSSLPRLPRRLDRRLSHPRRRLTSGPAVPWQRRRQWRWQGRSAVTEAIDGLPCHGGGLIYFANVFSSLAWGGIITPTCGVFIAK